MALNLELCVAVTHNFVSRKNLPDVLRFLRDRKELVCAPTVTTNVEGRFRRVASVETPAHGLHAAFSAALHRERPELNTEHNGEDSEASGGPSPSWVLASAHGTDGTFSFGF